MKKIVSGIIALTFLFTVSLSVNAQTVGTEKAPQSQTQQVEKKKECKLACCDSKAKKECTAEAKKECSAEAKKACTDEAKKECTAEAKKECAEKEDQAKKACCSKSADAKK